MKHIISFKILILPLLLLIKFSFCEGIKEKPKRILHEIRKIEKNNNKEIEISLNTLIILLDPDSIEFSLEKAKWKKNSHVIELPKILITKIKDKSKLEKCCLSYMNIKPFHCEQEKKEVQQKSTR